MHWLSEKIQLSFKSNNKKEMRKHVSLLLEIRKMYINAGYKTFENNKISDFKMWEIYKRQVGYVARQIIKTV